jgi:ArsR family transcriptional regulator
VAPKTIEVSESVLSCCAPLATGALTEAEADDLSQLFSALSDPARLRMLSIIASSGEAVCSCSLEGPLERSQPTVSHHTRILAEAGLIVGERRGRWTWWSAVPDRLSQVAKVLNP